MRVAFDVTAAGVSAGGIGRVTADQAAALAARRDLDVCFIGDDRMRSGRIARAVHGVMREGWSYPVSMPHHLRRIGADVVHYPAPMGSLRSPVPVVLSVYDVLPWKYPELFTRTNVRHQQHLVRRLTERADQVIASSHATRTDLIEILHLPPERIHVVPMGINPAFGYRPDPARVEAVSGVRGPYVLAVGTLEPRKNLITTIAAMEVLADSGLDIPLVVAGGRGWRDSELTRRMSQSRARVIPVGRVSDEDLVALYGGSTCLVFPSLYEGFGLPVLEAMACGAPVIAANTTSTPEVVGDAGVLVDPTDAEGIAEAIRSIAEAPDIAADLQARGLARAAEFTWDRTTDLTVQVYEMALDAT